MSSLKLHLDADTSIKVLHKALVERGHDVTRTPNNYSFGHLDCVMVTG